MRRDSDQVQLTDQQAIGQVMRSPRQGMRQRDIEAALAVARKVNCVIMFRKVNPDTAQLLDQKHPTKNFHIKGKSSEHGPMACFIPVDQSLSKLAGRSAGRIERSNRSVVSCLGKLYSAVGKSHVDAQTLKAYIQSGQFAVEGIGRAKNGSHSLHIRIRHQGAQDVQVHLIKKLNRHEWFDASSRAFETPLVLSDERFKQQARRGFYTYEASGNNYKLLASDSTGQAREFIAKPTRKGSWAIFYDNGRTPVQVLCDTHYCKPLVADYDLHEVMPFIADYGSADKLPYSPITIAAHNKINSRHDIDAKKLEKIEDPNMGNISPRVRAVVHELNKAMGRGDGLDTVHHNMNAASPFGDLDYPLTVMFPRPVADFPSVMMIQDYRQLVQVMQQSVDQGYVMRNHSNFGKRIFSMRRDSFKQARRSVTDLFSPRTSGVSVSSNCGSADDASPKQGSGRPPKIIG